MIDWLADTLLATSLLMALVLLIREPVRRQFGPAVAYGLWLIPALRLLMPPLTWTVERSEPVAGRLPPGVPGPAQPSLGAAAEPGLIELLGGWETLAVAAWLAGTSAMLLGGFLIYRRQRRHVLRDCVPTARSGKIRIVRSAAVRGPMAFGIFDRVIAVPMDFDARYDPCERRLALDHELAHHQSGDLIVNCFAFALLSLQWFNPLAWLSHAAFRFDQEAACDARVMGKASKEDRAAYANAIAKAASGRALLFAGALDRPGTLRRRLRSMLASTGTRHQAAGKALIALAAAAVMPLTASRAVTYVDSPGSAQAPQARSGERAQMPALAALTPAAATQTELASAAAPETEPQVRADGSVVLAGGVILGRDSVAFFDDDRIVINGRIARVEQLTRGERARLRSVIIESQRRLQRERAGLPARLARAQRETDRIRSGAYARELLNEREDLRRDLAEIDAEAAELRANGEDPERMRAELRQSLREAEARDVDREVREALAEADPTRIAAELRAEEAQMERLLARLGQLDGR
jgi:bla regulator protein blaR1